MSFVVWSQPIAKVDDALRLVEASYERQSRAFLLDGSLLPPEFFDLRPAAILRDLDLRRPIYKKTAAYGHFGRDESGFTWENTDKAAALRTAAGLG